MKMRDIVAQGAIVARLKANTRDEVVAELVDALVTAGVLPAANRDEVLRLALERERKGSTGFGKGVAIPHVKHPGSVRMAAAVGVSQSGIDFNALDKQPVYSVFLLLSPSSNPESHLRAMEVIFKNLSRDTFRRLLRQSSTAEDVWELLEDADGQTLGR
ncbi:MAG: PTS sugar transporter subunit IIA [Phycisphaerales bacterium]|nr:PTS sugar transporter subunit IIA [Phycisphaerales bacterium]